MRRSLEGRPDVAPRASVAVRARFNAMDLQRAPHWFRIGACVLVIALVTAIIYGLDVVAPTVSLVALYLFAVVPIAVVWGLAYAVPASIASMLTFNFLFLPPLYTFTLADTENWVALAIFLVTGIVVGDLAARVRRRAAEAEQREREEALLAEVATSFLQGTPVTEELDGLAERLRQILRAEHARVELGLPTGPAGRGVATRTARRHPPRGHALPSRRGRPESRDPPTFPPRARVAPRRRDRPGTARRAKRSRRRRSARATRSRPPSSRPSATTCSLRSRRSARRPRTLRSGRLTLSDDDRAAMLETIETESGRLERLVRDLLDLSRLQAGAAEPVAELWTIDELVAQAIDDIGPLGERVDGLAAGRPSAGPGRRGSGAPRAREPARECGEVLAAGRARRPSKRPQPGGR